MLGYIGDIIILEYIGDIITLEYIGDIVILEYIGDRGWGMLDVSYVYVVQQHYNVGKCLM